jgi:hypothetical protein
MNTALVSVVHPQDNDVFADMLRYYYNLGIKNYYIMLHKPDVILRNHIFLFETMYDVKVETFFNEKDEHNHDEDVKILTNAALTDGMEWLIGSDADELLVLKQHKNIEEFLSQFDGFPSVVLHFKWIDYRSDKDIYENAFINMPYRCKEFMDVTDKGWIKSCGKFVHTMAYITGFHDIKGCENIFKINPEQAFYAHFPERNFKQYEQKTLLQRKNWLRRYGFFYLDKDLEANPNYLKQIWSDRLITNNGQRQVCNNDKSLKKQNKMEYFLDPIKKEMFK